ncbi:DHA2 family efflux MFS transporter permease subunit [Pararhizobium sp.]|uniref:DHA2 family efflux MFS transporter permease subunit n=1 Tax=Pararhizobium sp. TaxID=1977563 RepID=UPI003BAA1F3B
MVSTADNTEIPPSSARSRLVAFVVAVSFFMQMLDSTIVVTSLPQMARSFGVEPVAMSIGLTVYMLTMAAFIPLSGWLGSRYGARNVFLAAIAIFVAASLFCGLSTTLAQFIAARAVQGFGAALMNPIGRIIVLRNAAKRDLVNAVALITWPALIAPVIGPVLGSFITTYVSWHWNFFINIPIGLIGLALVWHFVPQQKEQDAGRLDVIGFVLSALGLTLLLAGLESFVHGTVATEGVIVLLAAGLIMSAWAVRHFYRTDNPLLDLSAFSIPTFAFSTLSAGTASRLAINAMPFLIPLLFQVGFGLDAIATGTYILVYFAGNLAMKSVTTPLLRRFGFRTVLVVNGLLASSSIAACAVLSAGTPDLAVYALLFVAGLSRSMQFTALNTIGFADITPSQRSSASTLSSMLQQLAMVLGVAVAAAILNISQLSRGGASLSPVDFRWSFLVIGTIGMAASLRYLSLRKDAGAEVSGHRAD